LLHHFVLLLRSIASRGSGAADPYRLWKNDAPIKLAWIQPGVYDPQRRKLIHRLSRGKPMLGGIKVNSLLTWRRLPLTGSPRRWSMTTLES